MTGLPLLDAAIFAGILIIAFVAGGWQSSRTYKDIYKDVGQDMAALRQERQGLAAENKHLMAEVFELRKRVIELEARLGAALDEINRLSSILSKVE